MDGENKNTGVEEENKDVNTVAEGNENTSGKDDENTGKKDEPKTFTQEEVNRMMAKEKRQGRNSLLKELGFKDEASAKSASKSYNAWLEAQKTDDEKAAEENTKKDNELREAQIKAEISEAKVEAMMLGCQPKYVEDIITLAVAKKTEDNDFKTVIGELKQKYPVWFGESSDEDKDNKKAGQKGTGGNVSSQKKDTGKDDNKSVASRLAANKRNKGSGKSSFWS